MNVILNVLQQFKPGVLVCEGFRLFLVTLVNESGAVLYRGAVMNCNGDFYGLIRQHAHLVMPPA